MRWKAKRELYPIIELDHPKYLLETLRTVHKRTLYFFFALTWRKVFESSQNGSVTSRDALLTSLIPHWPLKPTSLSKTHKNITNTREQARI